MGFGLIVMVVLAHSAEMREWASSDGSSTMTASLVKVLGGKVMLKKDGGREITVPISKLCDEDQAYIAVYSRDRPKSIGKRNRWLIFLISRAKSLVLSKRAVDPAIYCIYRSR